MMSEDDVHRVAAVTGPREMRLRRYWTAAEVANVLEPDDERSTSNDVDREVTLP